MPTFVGFFVYGMMGRFGCGRLYDRYDWLVRFHSNIPRLLF